MNSTYEFTLTKKFIRSRFTWYYPNGRSM